jgi:molybdenum cofactor cytidylyltransferase
MGTLKQLLPYRGLTLVQHAVDQAIQAGFEPVIAVVGAQAESVRASLANRNVEIVENPDWESGMGSSVALAVRHLLENGEDSAAIALLLADQPLVTADHLKALRGKFHSSSVGIVAAEYNGTVGVPALFKRSLFGALANLDPGAGARQLLRQPGTRVDGLPMPEAAMDIDTPSDFAALNSRGSASSR